MAGHTFFVGDKVRLVEETHSWGGACKGDIATITSIPINENDNTYSVNIPGKVYGWIGRECCFELVERKDKSLKKSIMSSILSKFQAAFLSEPEKTFRKAGVTKEDGSLTSEGQDVFLGYLLKKHGADFKKDVVDVILEEEEKEGK